MPNPHSEPPSRLPPGSSDPAGLARALLRQEEGPVRTLTAAPKRVRIVAAAGTSAAGSASPAVLADTTSALYVWEHPYYPRYYVPRVDFAEGALGPLPSPGEVSEEEDEEAGEKQEEEEEEGRGFEILSLRCAAGGVLGRYAIAFSADLPCGRGGAGGLAEEGKGEERQQDLAAAAPLRGMVRVDPAAAVTWYEEDSPVAAGTHPRDPFKRVDVLFSSRPLRVLLPRSSLPGWEEEEVEDDSDEDDDGDDGGGGGDGDDDDHHHIELARAPGGCFHLYETGLPPRYYLPATAVLQRSQEGGGGRGRAAAGVRLQESATRTKCPYKGEARYYDVVITLDKKKKKRRRKTSGEEAAAEKGKAAGTEKGIEEEREEGQQQKEEVVEVVVLRDLVWCYEATTPECALVAGCLCFYGEKVDVEVGGAIIPRPRTHFA